jgi:glycosyltransferase involved in cell wall biosynthesis
MERVLARVVTGLLERGHDVTVVARSCNVPAHPRLRWLRVRGPGRPFPLAYPWFFLVGSLVVKRARGDAILSTGAIIANRVSSSAVHMCHHASAALGSSRQSRQTLPHRISAKVARMMSLAGERFCYRPSRAAGLIGVSQGVSAEVAEHFPDMPIVTISNGVDASRFSPNEDDRREVRQCFGFDDADRVALFVGGEWRGKGLRHAIGALAHADGWKLLVVGSGDRAAYQELAERLGVPDRVVFAGRVEDPAPYFCAADAFVLASAYETFSLVTYEAAASGLPLLVTPVSGVTDLLVQGESGWFIEPDPADIGSKLTALRADPELIGRMGAAGRAAVGKFTWERMVDSYAAHLVSAHRARVRCVPGDVPAMASAKQR